VPTPGLGDNTEKAIADENLLMVDRYISARKGERGLTIKGEEWVRNTLPRFAVASGQRGISLLAVTKDDIRAFLSTVDGIWYRHSHFRAIHAFYGWLEREGLVNLSPCYKMQAPKLPRKVMPRPTLPEVKKLIESSGSVRNKAIICLFCDTGFRLSEIASIQPEDIDWQR
jgi:site-specific recombinase XerD